MFDNHYLASIFFLILQMYKGSVQNFPAVYLVFGDCNKR